MVDFDVRVDTGGTLVTLSGRQVELTCRCRARRWTRFVPFAVVAGLHCLGMPIGWIYAFDVEAVR